MEWIFLIIAGLLEMLGVTLMNQWHHTKKWSVIVMLAGAFILSFYFLSLAMNVIPMGVAYAVWTGIGATGGAVVGMVFYGESKDRWRIFFIVVILSATVGLKLIT
ncbi:DMT family transporter [Halalkalibacter urbisdiaboli]|uniref:DMT family transporter n=1 Tax=Halalkalibacter urbisdiaboli TaxID=1960589 RepID=UPI000B434517|nr:multidrug efflux SMR transporter [Halalkalibacter urbisdiaboli]